MPEKNVKCWRRKLITQSTNTFAHDLLPISFHSGRRILLLLHAQSWMKHTLISVKPCQSMTSSNTTVLSPTTKLSIENTCMACILITISNCYGLFVSTHTHTLRIPFTEVVKNKQHEFLSCKYSLENLILQISQHLLPQFHSLNIED